MTWYLVQYSGQWGFVRADLVRVMGEQGTVRPSRRAGGRAGHPDPAAAGYAEPLGRTRPAPTPSLIKDAVNLRRTPSASGRRWAASGEYAAAGHRHGNDGTYTWYQVELQRHEDGYVRSDMCQMLTIAGAQSISPGRAGHALNGATVTPNKNNTQPSPSTARRFGICCRPTTAGRAARARACRTTRRPRRAPPLTQRHADPAAVANPAALLSSSGNLTVSNVPAVSENGTFTVYGTTDAYAIVTATVEVKVEPTATPQQLGFIASAIVENAEQTTRKTVGQAVADSTDAHHGRDPAQAGRVHRGLPPASYANYGVTYDNGGCQNRPRSPCRPPARQRGGDSGPCGSHRRPALVVVAAGGLRRTKSSPRPRAEEEETRMGTRRTKCAPSSWSSAAATPAQTRARRKAVGTGAELHEGMMCWPAQPFAPSVM